MPLDFLYQWFPTFLHRGPVKISTNDRGPAAKDPHGVEHLFVTSLLTKVVVAY